jgi:hypothetical protein
MGSSPVGVTICPATVVPVAGFFSSFPGEDGLPSRAIGCPATVGRWRGPRGAGGPRRADQAGEPAYLTTVIAAAVSMSGSKSAMVAVQAIVPLAVGVYEGNAKDVVPLPL